MRKLALSAVCFGLLAVGCGAGQEEATEGDLAGTARESDAAERQAQGGVTCDLRSCWPNPNYPGQYVRKYYCSSDNLYHYVTTRNRC